MAVDLLSDNSNMSPRISFSRDFCLSEAIPIEKRPLRTSNSKQSSLNSSIDFDFCIPGGVNSGGSFDQSSWSADELFCDGKILPTEIKKKPEKRNSDQKGSNSSRPNEKPVQNKAESIKQRKSEEDEVVNTTTEEKANTKSFWGFKRSSSLNCGSNYGRGLCPLPLLNRSNSTGSTSSKKQSSRKHTEQQIKLQSSSSLSSSSSSSSSSSNSNFQKPPLKKNYGGYSYGSHGGGIRVSPILNVAPSGNLFGLSSMFSGHGKDRNKKR